LHQRVTRKLTLNQYSSGKEVSPIKAKAFILIETVVGKNKEVVAALKKLEGIKSVDMVTGPYDIITIIEAETLSAVGETVTEKIHPIPGISRTVTCLAV
jgi:DNA-binding Lrp family transcriptional regulator